MTIDPGPALSYVPFFGYVPIPSPNNVWKHWVYNTVLSVGSWFRFSKLDFWNSDEFKDRVKNEFIDLHNVFLFTTSDRLCKPQFLYSCVYRPVIKHEIYNENIDQFLGARIRVQSFFFTTAEVLQSSYYFTVDMNLISWHLISWQTFPYRFETDMFRFQLRSAFLIKTPMKKWR